MENVIYQNVLLTASESPDGESPTIFYLTQERNFFAIFTFGYGRQGPHRGLAFIEAIALHYGQSHAIERAMEILEEISKRLANQ